jgi:hypothetical protein
MSITISGSGQIVKQLQTFNLTTSVSTTSSSYVTTGLTVNITPTNSANKILIMVEGAGACSTTNSGAYYTVYRGATDLGNTNGFSTIYNNASYSGKFRSTLGIAYLDSPSTTSSTTYTVYFKTNTVGTIYVNDDSTTSTITVLEIAYA